MIWLPNFSVADIDEHIPSELVVKEQKAKVVPGQVPIQPLHQTRCSSGKEFSCSSILVPSPYAVDRRNKQNDKFQNAKSFSGM